MSVALFGKKGLVGVIKDLEMRRSSRIVPMGPKSNDECPYKTHKGETHRQKKRKQCDHRGRDRYGTGTSPETLVPPESEGAWNRPTPRGSVAPPDLDFRSPGL